MRFASESLIIVGPVFALSALLAVWGLWGRSGVVVWSAASVAFIGLVLLAFFRDPDRHSPAGEGWVVSPADGKVLAAETLADGRRHVKIFLSVLDVHVNRVPVSGTIQTVTRRAGSYFHAGSARAEGNARVDVEALSPYGPVGWRQVSGSIARKISCRLSTGDRVTCGDKFGLIYFGSRMDVYLPASATLRTQPGLRVRAGETVIAQFPNEGAK
jgi:phosphatidylserine decarboxylase